MTLPIKIVLALAVAAGAWLLARKVGAIGAPASPGSGAPSTGGSNLAENPSSNPFADLFKSLTGSGTPSTATAPSGTNNAPSTGPARSSSKPGPRSDGKRRKAPPQPQPTRHRKVEGQLASLA